MLGNYPIFLCSKEDELTFNITYLRWEPSTVFWKKSGLWSGLGLKKHAQFWNSV